LEEFARLHIQSRGAKDAPFTANIFGSLSALLGRTLGDTPRSRRNERVLGPA
jgi:hypothetical protein